MLESVWRALFRQQSRPNPFLSYEWVRLFCESYAAPESISFWCYERDGNVVAIAPLQRHGARLSLLHNLEVNDYCGVLTAAADTIVAERFVTDIARICRGGFYLPLLREDDAFNRELAAAIARRGGNFATYPYTVNPYVDLPAQGGDIMASRPKRLRQEIRTTINHLNRMGQWHYEAHSGGTEAQEVLEALRAFHLSRQEGKHGTSIFQNARHAAFLGSIIGRMEPEVQTHLSALRLDGRIVSAAYSLIAGDTLYYWVPSFDHLLPSVSLGKLQIAEVMRDCAGRGIARFDFMGGEEAYKFQWASAQVALQEHILYPDALRRSVDRARRSLRTVMRDAVHRHPVFARLVRWG